MAGFWEKLLLFFGFSKIIKIEGVWNFDDLDTQQIGVMIDAYLTGENDSFDDFAMGEFMHAKLTKPDLLEIQAGLNEKAFIEHPDHPWLKSNHEFLEALRDRLLNEAVRD
ncbi:hypothetical protein [Maricaulis parjimensis]|uniref:hypothetical protein n=1 Tax=Maricaulis parjimensis TaxID=144023 RepID=UPI0019394415|nr:hypothetical protein [Maricaulis parjimensis]